MKSVFIIIKNTRPISFSLLLFYTYVREKKELFLFLFSVINALDFIYIHDIIKTYGLMNILIVPRFVQEITNSRSCRIKPNSFNCDKGNAKFVFAKV